MKTVIVDYATISPAVLETIVGKAFPHSLCGWREIDEEFFEFNIFGVSDLAMLEDVLAEYV